MAFIAVYCVLGGGTAFGLLYLIYRNKVKKGTIEKDKFLHNAPLIIGIINFVLAASFLLAYILNPTSFSSEQTIVSPVLYVLFTIFSTYFYVVAMPLSIGSAGISTLLYKKSFISKKNA